MAIASLTVPAPLRRRATFPPRDHSLRDSAIERFDAGDHLGAVRETLAYLLPGVALPDLAQEPLCLVQGTARMRVTLADGVLRLSSALATLPDAAQHTAALRYLLSRQSSTGQLHQPRLRGDLIALEFSDPLAMMHPLKLLEVLQRLATAAAGSDAWFTDEFTLAPADREPLAALDPAEFARAQQIWTDHWRALDELTTESRRRRSVALLDALGTYALSGIEYALPLHGRLRVRLRDASDDYNDRDGNPNRRESTLARCVKEMREVDAATLAASLGHARYAINPQVEGTPSSITSTFGGQRLDNVGQLRASGRYLEAAMALISDYVALLAQYSWPEPVEGALRAALDAASGRPWREAVEALWSHAKEIAADYAGHTEDDAEADAA